MIVPVQNLLLLLLFSIFVVVTTGYFTPLEKISTRSLKLSENLSENLQSVHLQLNNNDNNNNNNSFETVSNSPFTVLLTEYVNADSNTTIIASTEGLSTEELSMYSRYLFNKNLSVEAGIITRKRNVNLRCNDRYSELMSLWKSERLLVKSKDFPNNILNSEDKIDKFRSTIGLHVRKMKMVHEDSRLYDDIIQKFLINCTNITEYTVKNITVFTFDEIILKLKSFAVWFRNEFPYYYDNCIFCKNKRSNLQYGSVYPSKEEIEFQARITELYYCSMCNNTTRFPRFNSVHKVLDTRRGRCGEYSMLMLRMLNLLGWTTRWVSDFADHVWVEVGIGQNKFIHLDPCEASVNENLIYEGWGKAINYIFAYSLDEPYIEDVTSSYTSNYSLSLQRRESDGISTTIVEQFLADAKIELLKHKEQLTK